MINRRLISLIALTAISFPVFSQEFVSDTLGFRTATADGITDLLRSRIAGVRVSSTNGSPLGDIYVNIRGINTVHTDNQPLWIVDGAIVSTDIRKNEDAFWQFGELSLTDRLSPLFFLNPSEIESIQVLKDINLTSIYGARGANGVIIVNTKRNHRSTPRLEFDTNIGYGGHNHRISFSSAGNNAEYNISGTFRKTDGILSGDYGNRGSMKFNFRTTGNRKLNVGLNALLSLGSTSTPSASACLGHSSLTLALRDPSLSPTSVENWKSGFDDDSIDYRTVSSVFLQYNFIPSLYIRAAGGFDLAYNKRILFYSKDTEFGAPSEENVNGGRASNIISMLVNYNVDLELAFKRDIANKHGIEAKAVGQILGGKENFNTMNGCNFVPDVLRGRSLNVGNFPVNIHKFSTSNMNYGVYGLFNYNFKSFAGANLSYRLDWTANTFKRYPGISIWADFKNILFPNSNSLDALRLDLGYGRSGNVRSLPYRQLGTLMFPGEYFKPLDGTEEYYSAVSDVCTKEHKAGLNASFFKGRLSLGVTGFNRKTEDAVKIYQNREPESPFETDWKKKCNELIYERPAVISNWGVELTARGEIVRTRNWGFNVAANFTYQENRIISTVYEDLFGGNAGKGTVCNINAINLSVGNLCGYKIGKDGKAVDITGEGLITRSDMIDLGSTTPKFYGGLEATLRFYGFTLEMNLDGAAGHHVANLNNISKSAPILEDGSYALNSAMVERADYLRLSNLGLNYRFKLKSKVLKQLCLRLSCNNIATLSGYSGYSPDVSSFGFKNPGIDYGSYPSRRSIMIGGSIKF